MPDLHATIVNFAQLLGVYLRSSKYIQDKMIELAGKIAKDKGEDRRNTNELQELLLK